MDVHGERLFNDVNKRFLTEWQNPSSTEPSQFVLLGNYWQYYASPQLRDMLHVQLTDRINETLWREMESAKSNMSAAVSQQAMEAVYDITLRVGCHVKWVFDHAAYHDLLPRVIPLLSAGLCFMSQSECHTDEEKRTDHMHKLLTYVYEDQTMWMPGRIRLDLVKKHVYEGRRRWLSEIVRLAKQVSLSSAIGFVKRFPTAADYDKVGANSSALLSVEVQTK